MKKFIKKMIKKTEGFTLVELIVVIAILGILAAVAVPAYSGYLTKAKEAGDIVELDAVKTAAQAYYAKTGSVTEVVVEGNTVTINGGSTDIAATAEFKLYFTGSETGTVSISLESDTYKNGAQWVSGANDDAWIAH